MRRVLAQLLLLAVRTDSEGELLDGVWLTRCLHCRSKLWLSTEGVPLNGATLEHVVPQSWFEKRSAADLIADLDGPNDERNLALSCPRCNQSKGSRHDAKGPANSRAREVVTQLKETRMTRYRQQRPEDCTWHRGFKGSRETQSERPARPARSWPGL